MNIQFCCFSSLIVWGFFFQNFSLDFPYFSSIVYIGFYLLCYFDDDSSTSIFFYFFCYVFLYDFYSFYYYCFYYSFYCSVIIILSYAFSVFWYCVLSGFPSILLIAWYRFMDFAWKFRLFPWCYFIPLLIIYHSFLELCLSLIFHWSASLSTCFCIFRIHIWK